MKGGKSEPRHGLTRRQLAIIRAVLARYAHDIERVAVFGSRAGNEHKPSSDLDLVLYGSVDQKTADRIWSLLADSSLPIKVDVLVYDRVKKPELKRHIDLVAVDLFTRDDLLQGMDTNDK